MYLELDERTDTVQQSPSNDVTKLSLVIVPFQGEFPDCIPPGTLNYYGFKINTSWPRCMNAKIILIL